MTGECDPVHMRKCLRRFCQHGCPMSDGGFAAREPTPSSCRGGRSGPRPGAERARNSNLTCECYIAERAFFMTGAADVETRNARGGRAPDPREHGKESPGRE